MIRVFVRTGLLGQNIDRVDLPSDTVVTPRELLERFAEVVPKSVPVRIAVDGAIVGGEQLDAPLRDGQQAVVLPETGETVVGFIGYLLVQIIIAAAVSYAAYLLSPRPKPPGLPQDRGDDSSATYSWDGIKTSYGPGLPIAWGYGRHALGGQVIWMDGDADRNTPTSAVIDKLRVILSMLGHQIHRFGDLPAQSANALGVAQKLPTGLRINGNLIPDSPQSNAGSVTAWLRPGTQDQPALPSPFEGVRQTFSPNLQLNDANTQATFTWSGTERVVAIAVTMTAPSGMYRQDPTGATVGYQVLMTVLMRKPGQANQSSRVIYCGSPTVPYIGYWAKTFFFELYIGPGLGQDPGEGPIEITISRAQGTQNGTAVSQLVWRDLVIVSPHTLRYPGEALLGLEIVAGARFSGGQPQISQVCDMRLVRVWDEDEGWSPRCWDVPAAPFNFNTHPPGRNPAWCLLDFLLSEHGLGRWITEDKIDLPAFRAWAAFCDQDPNPGEPWGEAAFCIDVVGDQPKPAWDWVLTFCSAGRATPITRNGKLSVSYQYRDAHWDLGGGGAPAKTTLQLITAGNCEDVNVSWPSKAERPTVIHFQFLNEEKAYEQDTLPVEDSESTLNSPSATWKDQYRSEDVQAFGITRPSQLYREGRWRHRITRLVRRELTFVTGPWALAAEVGDLFDFQHEMVRPFDADVPAAMQVLQVDGGVPSVVVDHHLAGSGLEIVARDPDGVPRRASIASYTNGTLDGRNVATCVLAAPLAVVAGAACVVGILEKLTETYQMVAVTLQKDLKRQVRAIQWTPEAYDPITRADFEGDSGEPVMLLPVAERAAGDSLPPRVFGLNVAASDGGHRLRWARPSNKVGSTALVYLYDEQVAVWLLVGGTEDDEILLRGLRVGDTYTASVCLQNAEGEPVPPELGDQVEFVPEEFPAIAPPAVTGARANIVEDDLLVQWDDMQQRSIDYVEVRAGTNWTAARVLARERSPRATIPDPPAGVPLLLAARAPSGLYGPIVQIVAPGWTPPNVTQRLLEDDLSPSPAGAHDGTQWNATDLVLELQSGVLAGTYTSAEQDMGFQASFFWQVRHDAQELEDVLVGSLAELVGSGEALWRTASGRPASPASPGLDWRTRVQDLTMPVGDLPASLLARGYAGVVGSHTQALVETRFHVDGTWTPYRPHVDGVVVARRMQVRVTLGRRTLDYRVRVRLLTFAAYL